MTDTEFRRATRRFLRRYAAAIISLPSSAGNLYELYIYTIVCGAARRAGKTLTLHNVNSGNFRFRCSPGPPSGGFSYFSFRGMMGEYEIRNGIELRGHSLMSHESDILVVRVPPGGSMAANNVELILTIECKCYSAASDLKAEVRKNLGMAQDWSHSAHASQAGGHPQGCLHCGLGFRSMFATNVRSGQRADIEQYLQVYDLNPYFGVSPGSSGVSRLKSDLEAVLQPL